MTAVVDDYSALVERLGRVEGGAHWDVYRELIAAGEAPVLAVLQGLSHADWRVRRGCALYADHNPAPEMLERLKLTLNDPKAKVRVFAVHAIGCELCKPGGNPVDAVPLRVRAL